MLSHILLVLLMNCIAAQQIIYNKTFCSEDQFPVTLQSMLPQFPAYSMSISSSTYQAGKPISIEVKACKNNGFRAFLLQASLEGTFLAMEKHSFKSRDFKLGTIEVSCGVKKHSGVRILLLFFWSSIKRWILISMRLGFNFQNLELKLLRFNQIWQQICNVSFEHLVQFKSLSLINAQPKLITLFLKHYFVDVFTLGDVWN